MQTPRLGFAARAAILGVLAFCEKTILNQFVDFQRSQEAQGFAAVVREGQHLGLRFLVAFAAALALFACVDAGRLKLADERMRAAPVRFRWVAPHLACLLGLIPLSYELFRPETARLSFAQLVVAWVVVAGAGAVSAALILAPWRTWRVGIRALGRSWVYASLIALFSAAVLRLSQQLWSVTASLTFELVRLVLTPILPAMTADPLTRILRTPTFAVEVSELCSGLEGIGLIVAFTTAWLVYFRREFRFPRALLLIPAGILAMFLLNILRIAGLVLIGNAGHSAVAIYGFHSQAGWIAFIGVACGLVLLSRRSAWLNRAAPSAASAFSAAAPASSPPSARGAQNPSAAFLVPFLALLAAGIVSHAMSSDFEYFYGLRVLTCGAGLFMFRRVLRRAVDWHFSWRGVAVGAGVFVVWLVAAHVLLTPAAMPAKLAALSAPARAAWIAFRVLASVLLVPVAEELAYRGFLMRRICAAEFEHLPFSRVTLAALVISSVLFGFAHGAMWPAGIAAGVSYGLLARQRGGLGEPVIAHVASNGLVAATVLLAGQWQLW